MMKLFVISFAIQTLLATGVRETKPKTSQVKQPPKKVGGARGKPLSTQPQPVKAGKSHGAYLQTKRSLMVESSSVEDHPTAKKGDMYLQAEHAVRTSKSRVVEHFREVDAPTGCACEDAPGSSCSRSNNGDSESEATLLRNTQVQTQSIKTAPSRKAPAQHMTDPFASLDDVFDDVFLDTTSELLVSSEVSKSSISTQLDSADVGIEDVSARIQPVTTNIYTLSYAHEAFIALVVSISFILLKRMLRHRSFTNVRGQEVQPKADDSLVHSQNAARAIGCASREGNADRVASLLHSGAAVRAVDEWGCTSLHTAAGANHLSVAETLIDNGAHVDARDAWEETPLHFAARAGHTEMCRLLVGRGAAINAVDMGGQTPLLKAADASFRPTCEHLLKCGGGVANVSDEDLPPMLSDLLINHILTTFDAKWNDKNL